MTDQTTPERGTEQPSEGLPIPTLESPSSASSPSSVDVEAIAKQVEEKLRRELRMAQSTKDKNADLIRKAGISDLSELEALGATIPDNVKLEYRLRQIETGRQADNPPVQQPSSPGNGAALTAQDVTEAVQQFNLDANQADVIEALRGTYRNRDHFEATLAKLAMSKTNKPAPSAADSATITGSAPTSTKVETSAMIDRLNELQKMPSKNKAEIDKLVKELEARDWK